MPAIDTRRRETEDIPNRRRSVIVSPTWRFSPPGSRWGGFNLSFSQLRQLAKLSPTVQAIVGLRAAQLASFARAPRHKGDRGFEIVREDHPGEMSDHDKEVADWVFQYIMRMGALEDKEHLRPNLADFFKSTVRDLLIVGAATAELVYDDRGHLSEAWAIDASTLEIQWAERYIPTTRYGKDLDQPVRYVQVVDGQIETEYAADEILYMGFNPLTDITNGGYPMGNVEAAVDWISAEVLALQYNSNYFDHGSVPVGILALVGNYSDDTLGELNTMWETDVTGVVGQHKPVAIAVEPSATGGSSISWIPMKQSNRDMEMGDFVDKIRTAICGVFLTDPVEISQRSASNTGGMSASENTSVKIDLSRDKGLLPLLDLYETRINKEIVSRIAPGYIFRFTGVNAEDEEAKAKYLSGQLQQGALTAREWRKAMGLEEVPPGTEGNQKWLDAPGNPQLLQVWMQENGMQPKAPSPGDEPPSPDAQDDVHKSWAVY